MSWERKFGATRFSLGATYKFQTAVTEPTDDKALELNGSLSGKWDRAGARLSAVYSPDDFGSTRQSLYIEGGPSYDLTKTLRISANVGRPERQGSPDYTSFNAGMSKAIRKLTFDARYYDTAQRELGEIYRGRGVISCRLAF